MASLEELEQRMNHVEREMAVLREEAAAARALAAGADRDVADYRAEMRHQTQLINALRQTQAEQGAVIEAHYAEHKADLAEVKTGISTIVHMLERLDSGE